MVGPSWLETSTVVSMQTTSSAGRTHILIQYASDSAPFCVSPQLHAAVSCHLHRHMKLLHPSLSLSAAHIHIIVAIALHPIVLHLTSSI
jgi:hypothetical protein